MAAAKQQENDKKLSGKKATIQIHKDSNKYAIDPVPVSVNGIQFTIRRGVNVEVPVEVIEVLEHARETQYESVMNSDMSTTMVPRDVLSYPFSVLSVAQ